MTQELIYSHERVQELERMVDQIRRKDRLLIESQTMVNHLLGTVPMIIYIYDLHEKRTIYVNREVADLLGYTSDQIHSMGSDLLSIVIHSEDLPEVIRHHELLGRAEAGEVHRVKYRVKNAKGEWRCFLSADAPFEKESDKPTRFIAGCAQEMP